MNAEPISAVIITLNAERTLSKTIESMLWCDEILVVDSGSSDHTKFICNKYNCRFITKKFEGFGSQKKFAVNSAKNNWVWVIDADEVATPEIINEVKSIDFKNYHAFYIPISLVFMNKILRFGGEYKKKHIRLFNKIYGNYNLNLVHEDVVVSGPIGNIKNQVLHNSYYNIEDYFNKFNIYTSRAAEEIYNKNKRNNVLLSFIKLPFHFLILYLIKGLIFDGFPGLVWAMFSSWYSFVKQVKAKELKK